jgi:hypothetical protein
VYEVINTTANISITINNREVYILDPRKKRAREYAQAGEDILHIKVNTMPNTTHVKDTKDYLCNDTEAKRDASKDGIHSFFPLSHFDTRPFGTEKIYFHSLRNEYSQVCIFSLLCVPRRGNGRNQVVRLYLSVSVTLRGFPRLRLIFFLEFRV